jgi:hypothetical protein
VRACACVCVCACVCACVCVCVCVCVLRGYLLAGPSFLAQVIVRLCAAGAGEWTDSEELAHKLQEFL